MSKMDAINKEKRQESTNKAVVNYMGGTSYEINPLDTMKMITASSIFGEPQYYVDGEFTEKTLNKAMPYKIDRLFESYSIFNDFEGKNTKDIIEDAIDAALKHDFKATLEWAKTLRADYNMRLNPQVIMVRAAMMTEERKTFSEKNPGMFNKINQEVMSRADDVLNQLSYYLYINDGKKNKIPGILKRSWEDKIESLTPYEMYKYKNHGLGIINAVRITHANNELVNELMTTGTVKVPEESKTWETLRANGATWDEITDQIKMNHMALLRNLRGIFSELDNPEKTKMLLDRLVSGVEKGKQFPNRYTSTKREVEKASDNLKVPVVQIADTLEDCIDKACENLPHLAGNNAFLSDNSGSAWDTCNSEYGKVTVASIGNLSATIGAANSDNGTVVAFGDRMIKFPISKRNGILTQSQNIDDTSKGGHGVGSATENGIWLFMQEAIDNKIKYDNIFVYSDMQAGHGGLYGTQKCKEEYSKRGFSCNGRYIDVAKLIDAYRKEVNPKVNVFCIQTAGYNNVLVPEYGYRTNILYGWTGKELVFADAMNKFWDAKDKEIELKKEQTAEKNKTSQDIDIDADTANIPEAEIVESEVSKSSKKTTSKKKDNKEI